MDTKKAAEASSDNASMPWWAQEMGMIEAEYWSGLHECNQAIDHGSQQSRITPVEVTQVHCSCCVPKCHEFVFV